MSTIVTRSGKGSPLTHTEVDDNFTNLNTDKYQEGSAIGAVTPAAGTFTTLTATGQTSLGGAAGSESFRVYAPAGVTRYLNITGTAAGDAVLFADGPTGSTPAVAIYSRSTGLVKLGTAATNGGTSPTGTVQFQVSHTASAVNYVQVTGGVTGSQATISAQGSDTNIGLLYRVKGTSSHYFQNGSGSINFEVLASGGGNANYVRATGAATTVAPSLSAQGGDTNIDLTLTPKGTGNVRFGTLTASADAAITGYITIKDSGGTVRKLAVIA